MTPVTTCQTQHNIPASRETVGAAVRAVVRIATDNRMAAKVATVASVKTAAAPRSSARKARARRVAASR